MNRYNIYPTLLDKFHDYLFPERLMAFGKSEDDIQKELIDGINRVPFESEPADRGTAFNEVLDGFIKTGTRPDTTMQQIVKPFTSKAGIGYSFPFSSFIVDEFVEYLSGGMVQVACDGVISTPSGIVNLYGYADAVKQNMVYDVKTTGRYEFPKYTHGYQRHVYPLCLTQMGCKVDFFEYIITDFSVTYREGYLFNYAKSEQILKDICERMICFLEASREKITDKKIFNQ